MRLAIVCLLAACSCAHMPAPLDLSASRCTDRKTSKTGNLTIRLLGTIDSDAADLFIEDMEAADGNVLIEINGPGGDIGAGWRIMRTIERYPYRVTCVVDEWAASMDMLILESCDRRVMTKRSVLMAHEIGMTAIESGNPNNWIAVGEMLKKLDEAVSWQYIHCSSVSFSELREKAVGGLQWWIGWKEALDLGFVDEAVERVEDVKAW